MEVSEGGKTKEDVPMDTQPAVAPVTPAPATAPRSVESEAAQRLRLANAGYAPIKHQFVKNRAEVTPTAAATEGAGGGEGDEESRESKKDKKRKRKGMNRKRRKRGDYGMAMCSAFIRGDECQFQENCKYSHDLEAFRAQKPADIPGIICPHWARSGSCKYRVACRLESTHLPENVVPDSKPMEEVETNTLSREKMSSLRKRKYEFSNAEKMIAKIAAASASEDPEQQALGPIVEEKRKTVDFRNKLMLAPLTTVGNLPFRRICKEYGADITCGEMALATNLLQGQRSEWALLRRHESEDIFGAQVCGHSAEAMTRCAELLCKETDLDFIDINVGCPIDLVYKKGAGSALMDRRGRFRQIVKGMSGVMDIPLTVKLRTGVYSHKPTAHKLTPVLQDWGAELITLHGRSREMRYTKTSDWDYIKQCAQATELPFYGNGDILSFEEAVKYQEEYDVSGVMLGRGALYKPWLFTEIKEKRHWDISSHERMEHLKRYCNYGLEHWGSDTQGVEKTRKFLLEWLSFLYRYIPVGLLERLPQKINERPPPYTGRDDLETLMASPDSRDWVKISEMLLGPVGPNFEFLPKHKSNSYDDQEIKG